MEHQPESRMIKGPGGVAFLTKRENEIMTLLIQAQNKIVSWEAISPSKAQNQPVATIVGKLRKKLQLVEPSYTLKSMREDGYLLLADPIAKLQADDIYLKIFDLLFSLSDPAERTKVVTHLYSRFVLMTPVESPP